MASEGGPLWVDGEIVLRPEGGEPVRVRRPYALIGRTEGVDVRVPDRRASARHVYLHLDRRGLFAVDLATRTGTRFNGESAPSAWLEPGQWLEIADRRIEVLDARAIEGGLIAPGAARPAALTDAADAGLPRLSLQPLPATSGPWIISSELVFLGRSSACGVPIHGAAAARVHAVIVRTPTLPYIVNLIGAGLWLDGRAVRTAAALIPDAVLTAGSSRFEVRLEAAPEVEEIANEAAVRMDDDSEPMVIPLRSRSRPRSHAADDGTARTERESSGELATTGPLAPEGPWPTELVLPEGVPPPPPELFQSDSQAAVLAWMMGVVQATQSEMMRRQHDFQMELIRALRGLHEDNQAVLQQHQARVEEIHRELASLRDDIRQRFSGAPPAAVAPPRPKGPPIQIPKVDTAPSDPSTATAWLLDRVNRLDEANRATWKDLLGRLGGGKNPGP